MRALISFLLLGLALLPLAACEVKPTEPPALPSGFSGDLPDVPLDGFLYVNQGQPITLGPDFASTGDALVGIDFVALFFAPSQPEEAVGAIVSFTSPPQAQVAFTMVPPAGNRWKDVSGNDLFLVIGSGPGAEALKDALRNRPYVKLEMKEPDVWKGVQRLPSSPPAKAVGVGYIKPTAEFIQLLREGAPGLGDVAGAVEQAKIKFAVIGLYSEKPIDLGAIKSAGDLQKLGAGGVLVAKMDIPSVTVGTVFNTVARLIGLEKATFDGEEAFARNLEGLSLLLKAKGGYIYGAASPNQAFSWRLLQSALTKK